MPLFCWYVWLFSENLVVFACVLKIPWKILWEREMRVWKLFKSTNMLFSICFRHQQFNIFSPEFSQKTFHPLKNKSFVVICVLFAIFRLYFISSQGWFKTCDSDKHHKNCECCPCHSLTVSHKSSKSGFKTLNLSGTVNWVITRSPNH